MSVDDKPLKLGSKMREIPLKESDRNGIAHPNERKLYIEYRVYFDPRTNQDNLHEVGAVLKDRLQDMFEDMVGGDTPITSPEDVSYEVVMEIK